MSNKRSFIDKIREIVFSDDVEQKEFKDYKEKEGRILRIDSLEVGSEVKEIDEEGNLNDVENGEYLLEDENKSITVEDSKILEVKDIENTEEGEEESETELGSEEFMEIDLVDDKKGKIDAIEVGNLLEIANDEGVYETATEGEHELADGTILVTDSEGMVIEVREVEAELSNSNDKSFDSMIDEWFTKKMESDEAKEFLKYISDALLQAKEVMSKFEDLEKENNELKEKFTKFSKEPEVDSITDSNKSDIEFSDMNKESKLRFLSKR